MKNLERTLVAAGVALVLSGGIASAAIVSNATAAAAQPDAQTQVSALIGGAAGGLADNGGRGGADRLAAAATYIGIPATDIKAQLESGKSLTDIAAANGKTRDGLIAALVAAEQKNISTFVDQKGVPAPAGGPGGHGGPGAFGHGGFGAQGDPLAAAATFLGITPADLRTKMQGGQTLAAIAATAGKTRDGLIQALVSDAKTAIAKAKADGKLTADQATQLESGVTDRISRLVDSAQPGPRR